MKSIRVLERIWRKLKQNALDRDMTIAEVIEELVDVYL